MMSVHPGGGRKPPQDYGLLATNLADMARELHAQDTVQKTLDSAVAHAVKLVDGCEAAGILTVEKGKATTLAASDPVAQVSDRIQAQLSEGPCFDAIAHGQQIYRVEDMQRAAPRWSRYAHESRDLGVGSMMGSLLYASDRDNLGALNLYSRRRGAFGEQSEHVGWVVASHTAVALSNARHAENMGRALATSRLIGEAIGVVMSRYHLTEDDAFEAIRHHSQVKNIKVRELSETITAIGELPRA